MLHLIGGGDVGGAKTHVITLLSEMAKEHDIALVSFREGEFAEDARLAGICVHVANGTLLSDIRMVYKLSEGYEIIHCHGARANMVGMILRKRMKVPVITTIHSDYRLDYLGRPFARITYGVINKLALRILDYRIGVSDLTTLMLINRGFRPETLFTICNGIDFNVRDRDTTKQVLAERLGLDYTPGDIFAGIAARLNPVKDVATFIRTAARTQASCPQLRYLVAGDGEQMPVLRKLAEESGARIEWLGWISNMESFFQLLDINCLTSLSEGFPYAITEGARMSCATVATAVGGIPQLIDHGINGYLFNPTDDAVMAEYLEKLYHEDGLIETMGDKLHDKAEQFYSVEVMVHTQLTIYETILRRSSRPRKRRDGITLCGAYGMDNAGDDAILEAILQEIREQDPDIPIRVLSRNPLETRLSYREPTFHTFNIFAFTRAVRKSRLYLSGGGNLVQDTTSQRSLWFYLLTIMWAKKMGCKVIMYGCGIGPIHTEKNRKLTARILNRYVEVITLREGGSIQELQRMGVTGPRILATADPALILTPAPSEKVDSLMYKLGLPLDGRYIGFALRKWPSFEERVEIIAQAADYAYETYGLTPVFIPVERKQDVKAAQLASRYTRVPHYMLTEAGTARVAIGLMSRMQLVVAMRLHALIFAASQGLPVVGISYNEKVSAFLRYLGQDLSTPLEEISIEGLRRHIDNAVNAIPFRQERLQAIERLREKEKGNQRILGEMLQE